MGCTSSKQCEVLSNEVTQEKEQGISEIYNNLPNKAEKHNVRNVYDGDTFTLLDGRRVRFLGIDTPELKERQAFAQEAKDFTKNLCGKNDVWLSFENDSSREDRYGRILAFVWVKVKSGNGYLNVNESLVSNGLAHVYKPGDSKKLYNWDKLVLLQRNARKSKRGIWSTFKDFRVYVTRNGSAFHKRDCKYVYNSKTLSEVMASEASDKGLHPCRSCLSD